MLTSYLSRYVNRKCERLNIVSPYGNEPENNMKTIFNNMALWNDVFTTIILHLWKNIIYNVGSCVELILHNGYLSELTNTVRSINSLIIIKRNLSNI